MERAPPTWRAGARRRKQRWQVGRVQGRGIQDKRSRDARPLTESPSMGDGGNCLSRAPCPMIIRPPWPWRSRSSWLWRHGPSSLCSAVYRTPPCPSHSTLLLHPTDGALDVHRRGKRRWRRFILICRGC